MRSLIGYEPLPEEEGNKFLEQAQQQIKLNPNNNNQNGEPEKVLQRGSERNNR